MTGSEPALFDAKSLDGVDVGVWDDNAVLEALPTVVAAPDLSACASSADTATAATSSVNRNMSLNRSPIVLAVLVWSSYGCARWRLDGL